MAIDIAKPGKRRRRRLLPARLVSVSWRDLLVVVLPLVAVVTLAVWAAVTFIRPAPPDTIRLLGGAEGSTYRTTAERYKKIIEGRGVKVEILPSRGSLDNLHQLIAGARAAEAAAAAKPGAQKQRPPQPDVGFVQGGLIDTGPVRADAPVPAEPPVDISGVMSLGSLFAQPLMVYHRQGRDIELLSELRGKRLAIGPEGSGTRALALKLLKANDIDGQSATLLELAGEEAARALQNGTVDAAFLMGDSATPRVMRSLRDTPGVEMVNFRQAAGYVRKFRFLSRLTLPEGAIDLGKNYPRRPMELVGPTVELVARKDLHPALSDLLISAAREVHGGPGMFRDAGEFPAPLERDFPLSADAERYYKSGGQFLYKRLPFWLASLLDRMLVVVVPLLVLLVPAGRMAPGLYRWRVRSRIYRWYGALMAIERDLAQNPTPQDRATLEASLRRLDEIEDAINAMKTPLSFADQLYVLREHVIFVRHRLEAAPRPPLAAATS
jgi:hypothetical protein